MTELIMECGCRRSIIDATPDFSLGKYFAHARLVRASLDDDADVEMRIERGIGWFDTENEAIEAAQQWAFGWIGRRDGSVVGNAGDPPVPGRDASAGTY